MGGIKNMKENLYMRESSEFGKEKQFYLPHIDMLLTHS